MKKQHNFCLATTLFLVASCVVDASSRAGSASRKHIGGSRGLLDHSERRFDPSVRKHELAAALHQLRGGSSQDSNSDADAASESAAEEQIDPSLVDISNNNNIKDGEEKKSSGWGLFSKTKTNSKSENGEQTSEAEKEEEEEDEDSGSFEITMNTSPDGTNNVKVDIETPKAVQEMAQGALDKMEETVTGQKQPGATTSVAHQVSAGGATSSTEASTTSTKAASTAHISSKFPISPSELPHFACMSFMMFLFIYVFTTVRDTKDTLVVSNCGAEAIPFLKLYAVMPCATAFIVIYSKLSNALGKQALFYTTLIPFFIFYGIFAFVLFPMRDALHFPLPDGVTAGGGAGSAAMNLLRYWSFSLFFIVSELWASAGVPLLFWQVSDFYELC